LGSTVVPTVIGMVFGATSSFQLAFLALAAGPLLAVIPMLAIRPTNPAPSQNVPVAAAEPAQ
jgi:hypothetical protein